ncbi:MAG TPA: helix-turn-helix domain-containing protein [Candidatus Tectomicrobia bacterium]
MPATSRPRKRVPALSAARLPEVLDVHMTAQFLTVSADTVYDLFHHGDLPGRKVGRKWLTTKTAVLRWLEQSTKQNTETQKDAALARAIENGDRVALVAAMHTGKARIQRKRRPPAR